MKLAERIERLEDIEAIRAIAAEMMYCADRGDAEGMLKHMREDIYMDAGEYGVCRGQEEARAWLQQVWTQVVWRQHHLSNAVIRVEGNRAFTQHHYQALLIISDRSVLASGIYEDEWQKEKGRWLITARRTKVACLSPLEEGWAKTRLLRLG